MIDFLAELMATPLYFVLLAAWRALPVFIAVGGVSLLLRKRVAAQYLCLLWMLVVVRLLLPVSVWSPVAVSTRIDSAAVEAIEAVFSAEASEETTDPDALKFGTFTFSGDDGDPQPIVVPIVPDDASPDYRKRAEAFKADPDAQLAAVQQLDVCPASSATTMEDCLVATANFSVCLLILAWPIGCSLIFVRGIVAYAKFAWQLRACPTIAEPSVIDQTLRVCDSIGIGRRPQIKRVDHLQAPAMFGLWRPVLCLPADWDQLSTIELNWVLRHELAHVKRRDGWVMTIASVAKALHWIHPISWIAFNRLQTHVEHAADDVATLELSTSDIGNYGRLLLRYANAGRSAKQQAVLGLLSMASSRGLKNRIEALEVSPGKHQWGLRVAVLTLIGGLAAAGLTDANSVDQDGQVIQDKRPRPIHSYSLLWRPDRFLHEPSGSQMAAEIDVRRSLDRLTKLDPNVNAESFLEWLLGCSNSLNGNINDGVLHANVSARQKEALQTAVDSVELISFDQVVLSCQVAGFDMTQISSFGWYKNHPDLECRQLNQPVSILDSKMWDEDPEGDDAIRAQTINGQLQFVDRGHKAAVSKTPILATKVKARDIDLMLRICRDGVPGLHQRSPNCTVFSGCPIGFEDRSFRPFVTNLKTDEGRFAPVISLFPDGWAIELQATVTTNQRIDLRCIFNQSSITDVSVVAMPHRIPFEGARIQDPTVKSTTAAIKAVLSQDEALLIFVPPTVEDAEPDGDAKLEPAKVYVLKAEAILDSKTSPKFSKEKEKSETGRSQY